MRLGDSNKFAAFLCWFAQHLEALHQYRRVSIKVYVTRASTAETVPQRQPSTSSHTSYSSGSVDLDPEKEVMTQDNSNTRPSPDLGRDGDPLSAAHLSTGNTAICSGRPDIASLIKESVESIPSDKRVLVMGCGPKTLMSAVQDATADAIMDNGAGVELHLEKFGW